MSHIQVNAEAAHEAAHPWYELRDAVGQKHSAYVLAKAVIVHQRVLAKLQADHSGAVTDMVSCTCGDLYPADSFGAGFIAATGHCQNCDAAEQAEQEPVGVVTKESLDGVVKWNGWIPREGTKLYAAPVRTKDLTDDEIHKAFYSKNTGLINGIRAVIAKDREKNK